MALKVTKVDVWAGETQDRPGDAARLLDVLASAGANIECVIGRRQPDKPGTGVLFIWPVKGKKVQAAAQGAGMSPTSNIATLRVEGSDKKGLGAKLTHAIADVGVNLRGISAAVIGTKFAAFFAFDNADDAAKAAKALKGVK
jgi:predicted amino acid-binding ACT domain protein